MYACIYIYISNNARERLLTDNTIGELAEEVIKKLHQYGSDRVVVNLSNNDLTLACLQKLAERWTNDFDLPVIRALDVSLNRIKASSGEFGKEIAALLGDPYSIRPLVGYLNLSLNYLPPLGSLDGGLKEETYSYGTRLSLGFNHELPIDVPDIDYWTYNTREFERVAYGQQF